MHASARRAALAIGRSRAAGGGLALAERLLPPARTLTVLVYHRILDPRLAPGVDPGMISAAPAELERQVRFLAATRTVVSLDDVLAARRGEAALPARAVLVTFDDAYRDFAEAAWPVLQAHGVPATLFVPTGYPDRRDRVFWWDRLSHALLVPAVRTAVETPLGRLPLGSAAERRIALRRVRDLVKTLPHEEGMALVDAVVRQVPETEARSDVLGWAELRRLAREGVTLAPHTRMHPRLDRIAPEAAVAEAVGSRRDLISEIGSAPSALAYPGGGATASVATALAAAGFELGFTTVNRVNDLHRPRWLTLARVNVGLSSPLPFVRARLLALAGAGAPPGP